jgi:arabinofuranosyltransferase
MMGAVTHGTDRGERRLDILLAGACFIAAVVVFVSHHDLRHDDAYITFKYARSIVEGDGFVFNPDERILGTSSPLFTLLMAFVYAVFGDVLAQAAIAVSAIALAGQGWLIWFSLRRQAPIVAGALALSTVLGLGGGLSFLGLETALFTFLVFATVVSYERSRYVLAGVCLGLAILTRYDAGLLAFVLLVWIIRDRKVAAWRTVAASAALVLPWLIFARLYFGGVFPHTLAAKTSLTPWPFYVDHYASLALSSPVPIPFTSAAVFPVVLVFALAAAWARRHAPALLCFFGYGVLHAVAYTWIGPSRFQHWHMVPPIWALRLALVLGVFGWVETLARERSGWKRLVPLAITASAAIALVVTSGVKMERSADQLRTSFWLGERHARYTEVAHWMGLHVSPDSRFMATEVGTLGYLTRMRMVDPFGLINDTNDWPRTKSVDAKVALIEQYRPDVVLLDSQRELQAVERIGYRLAHVFPWQQPWAIIVVAP